MRTIAPLRRIACFLALLVTALGFAAEPTLVSFDIPSDSAAKALKLFAQQSGSEVIIRSDKDGLVKTNAVRGEFTAAAALDALLKDTGLVADRHAKTGAFAIRSETETESKNVVRAVASDDRPVGKIETGANGEKVLKLDTFEVFGRKTLNMDIRRTADDPQPYVVFNREQIGASGATSLEDFLVTRLPMNTSAGQNSQQNLGNFDGDRSSINLRGLGENQTLILVDGHRVAGMTNLGTGLFQPNVNGIPLGAVERVEVLPTTASGIYGGSATGGVINIVLRRDYSGVEVGLTYENTFKTDAARRRIDFSAGLSLEAGKTTVLLSASLSDSNQLLIRDRDLLQRGRQQILINTNYNFRALEIFGLVPPFGAGTNILSATGSNLILKNGTPLNSPITFVPANYSGAAADGGTALVANAGKYNTQAGNTPDIFGGGEASLGQAPTSQAYTAMVRRKFSPRVEVFVEAGYSRTDSYRQVGTVLFNGLFLKNIPASSPNNPFLQAIRISPAIDYLERFGDQVYSNRDSRVVVGTIFKLPGEWQAEADYTWNRTRRSFAGINVALNAAGVQAILNGTVDVLRDLEKYPVDLGSYLYQTQQIAAAPNTLSDAVVRFSGPLFALPAGRPQLSAAFALRKEALGSGVFSSAGFSQYNPERTQVNGSGYFEIRFPLVDAARHIPALRAAELQTAVRWDDYRIDGVPSNLTSLTAPYTKTENRFISTNPTIALKVEPSADISLRGSYGTGFLPPGLDQLAAAGQFPDFVTDPRRGGNTASITHVYGGTPDLKPERSTSSSLGVIVTPRFLPGLRISVDFTRINKRDNIASHPGGVQGIVNDEALYPGHVVRDAPAPGDPYGVGQITTVYETSLNLARAEVEAIDYAVEYTRKISGLGTLSTQVAATNQQHYRVQSAASQTVVDYVGVQSANPLKWRGNLNATLKMESWSIGWAAQYYDGYFVNTAKTFDPKQGGATVAGQIYHDLFIKVRPRKAGSARFAALVAGLEITVGVKNVFDRKPPFDVNNNIIFTSLFGDTRGVSYYLSLKKAF